MPPVKLTKEDVKLIHKLYSTGSYTQKELAIRFNVCQWTISATLRGEINNDLKNPMSCRLSLKERFNTHIDKNGPKIKKYVLKAYPELKKAIHCWMWIGHVDKKGYGYINVNSLKTFAHRLAYEFFYKKKLKANSNHKCDNPGCVRGEHLFDGTQKEGVHDMIAKGRSNCFGKER